jgi:hypothetical protein
MCDLKLEIKALAQKYFFKDPPFLICLFFIGRGISMFLLPYVSIPAKEPSLQHM